jgi:hypothetical protein
VIANQIAGALGNGAGGGGTSFESIATATATGGETSLTLSSIPQTYKSLQIRYIAKDTFSGSAGYNAFTLSVNTNNTWITHHINGNGTTVAAGSLGAAIIFDVSNSGSGLTNIYGTGIIDLIDYSSTTKNKTLRAFTGLDTNSSSPAGRVYLLSLGRFDTSAITSITFNAGDTAWAAGTKFALYGIKG